MAVYTQIDDPSAHFKVQLYTGNAGTQTITFDDTDTDMQPDLIWIKCRGANENNVISDSVRGDSGASSGFYTLHTNTTDTEYGGGGNEYVSGITSDGFSVGNNDQVNVAQPFVAWCWKANGSGSSNTAGSINTTATSANTTAGFSIVTWTGDENSSATLGHGLGAVPKMIITKGRTYASSWATYHNKITADYWLQMCETDAAADVATIWNDTEPTSTLFTVGSSNQVNDDYNYVAYVFAEKQGFSKFGKYTGNNNADGPFIYTGFKPAWLMVKATDTGQSWSIVDTKRNTYNQTSKTLFANNNSAEQDSTANSSFDILSNGFKPRMADADVNGNGNTYIYMAFAESPFVNSKGVPANAR